MRKKNTTSAKDLEELAHQVLRTRRQSESFLTSLAFGWTVKSLENSLILRRQERAIQFLCERNFFPIGIFLLTYWMWRLLDWLLDWAFDSVSIVSSCSFVRLIDWLIEWLYFVRCDRLIDWLSNWVSVRVSDWLPYFLSVSHSIVKLQSLFFYSCQTGISPRDKPLRGNTSTSQHGPSHRIFERFTGPVQPITRRQISPHKTGRRELPNGRTPACQHTATRTVPTSQPNIRRTIGPWSPSSFACSRQFPPAPASPHSQWD